MWEASVLEMAPKGRKRGRGRSWTLQAIIFLCQKLLTGLVALRPEDGTVKAVGGGDVASYKNNIMRYAHVSTK